MSQLLLVGEAWGENEEKLHVPFVGAAGVELLRMLVEAGIIEWTNADGGLLHRYYREGNPSHLARIWLLHEEVRTTNVFNARPRYNKIENFCGPKAEGILGFPALFKSSYVRREFISQLDRLADEIATLDPNLIVCLGNSALWALGGSTGISKLRGTTRLSTHTITDYKLLPTYHPAAVLRQWELRPTAVADLIKANREQTYPEIRRPHREIWIEPNADDVQRFISTHVMDCEILSVDIETSGSQITCIGLSPRPDLALVVPFVDRRKKKSQSYWPDLETEKRVWHLVQRVLEDRKLRKVFQNGMYDIAFLWRSQGILVREAEHDTMLLHHSLQPESLKALGYLGSIYTDEGAWKTERKTTTIKRDE
jgi:uracil-DNA glycosylase